MIIAFCIVIYIVMVFSSRRWHLRVMHCLLFFDDLGPISWIVELLLQTSLQYVIVLSWLGFDKPFNLRFNFFHQLVFDPLISGLIISVFTLGGLSLWPWVYEIGWSSNLRKITMTAYTWQPMMLVVVSKSARIWGQRHIEIVMLLSTRHLLLEW